MDVELDVENLFRPRRSVSDPSSNATVSGQVWAVVWIDSLDTTPPYKYSLSVGGQITWTEPPTSSRGPVSMPWDSKLTPNGSLTVTATVTDAANKSGTASVSVVIQNGTAQLAPAERR